MVQGFSLIVENHFKVLESCEYGVRFLAEALRTFLVQTIK